MLLLLFVCLSVYQEYARLLKSNFKTIDGALYQKHLFQMTVSPSHSVNLAGLNAALAGLGLIGESDSPQPAILYFAVPPDVFPVYRHVPSCIVPVGEALPSNVSLMVLEIPLPEQQMQGSAAATSAAATLLHGPSAKRRLEPEDADTILPPAKLQQQSSMCQCTTGCMTGRCCCFKNDNKCGPKCHSHAAPASAQQCRNASRQA